LPRAPRQSAGNRARRCRGLESDGRTFDCGSKLGCLSANVAYALEHDDLAPAFRAELARLIGES
jgi:UTP--glucose-1-phosphate uridylyltransferase